VIAVAVAHPFFEYCPGVHQISALPSAGKIPVASVPLVPLLVAYLAEIPFLRAGVSGGTCPRLRGLRRNCSYMWGGSRNTSVFAFGGSCNISSLGARRSRWSFPFLRYVRAFDTRGGACGNAAGALVALENVAYRLPYDVAFDVQVFFFFSVSFWVWE